MRLSGAATRTMIGWPVLRAVTRAVDRMHRWPCWIVLWTLILSSSALGENPVVRDDGRSLGSPTAPVTLIEYSDFTCGYCVKFFRETWPRLRTKYVESGLVRFVYRDFPRGFQGPGLQAAVAARCAGEQGRYWPMHDRLFSGERALAPAEFDRYASVVGLDLQPFSSCVRDGRHVDAILRDRDEGVAMGFRGTPGFVIVPTDAPPGASAVTIPGAFPFEVFDEHLQRVLSAVKGKG